MSVVQTVLVFVGIPGGIISLIALAVYGKTITRQPNRYRPGRQWDYPPTWFVPHPDAVVASQQSASEGKQLRKGSYLSIELNTLTAVPEWDGQKVFVMMDIATGFNIEAPKP